MRIPPPSGETSSQRSKGMSQDIQVDFEWDPEKARQNLRKHEVAFEEAATVFQDAVAGSLYDEEHSDQEDRWITLGRSSSGRVLVVCHTFDETTGVEIRIRIFSARPATRRERRQYEEGP